MSPMKILRENPVHAIGRVARSSSGSLLFCLGLVWVSASAFAAKPELANIYPDYPGFGPHILTGENFDTGKAEVWVWEPPDRGKAASGPGVPVPAEPPQGARRVDALDVEKQVIVASLEGGSVVWVKTDEGWSHPLLHKVARPLWVSEEQAAPGQLVFVFGFGLRAEYRTSEVVLRKGGQTQQARTIVEARALRTPDKRLIYFEVPKDAAEGKYEVFCHNSYGGAWGWQKAGDLAIQPPAAKEPAVFEVRRFGAKGDGLSNDTKSIQKAVDKAREAGGGIVFFAPGIYLTDETIVVPAKVRLRGANRETAVIRGFGDPGKANRVAWFHSLTPPTAVVQLRDHTGLEALTIEGATWKGRGGYGQVETSPEEVTFPVGGVVRDVLIADCRLRALEEDAVSRRPLYLCAFHAAASAERIKLQNNDIFGSANFGVGGVGPAVRADIIGNTFHGGAVSDVVTIGGSFNRSLIDANILTDTPGRITLGMGRHNYIRFNEIHQAFRSTWENAEEIYLVHGGVESHKTVSKATGASANSLMDAKQNWRPGLYRDATVLIISGRGFGQYRRVTDNTKDALSLDKPWNVTPDATSEYVVAAQFVENAFFANLNNTPCRMSLWLDCIANQVEMHRDDHSKGTDLWGEDASEVKDGTASGLSKFFPSWYNAIVNCWMDGTALWLGTPGAHPNNAHTGYPSFGNYVVRNRIREPHSYRTGFDANPHAGAGIELGGGLGRAGTSHTVIIGNFLASTYAGISVSPTARKTFLLQNEFDHVQTPVRDRGAATVLQGNRVAGSGGENAQAPDSRQEKDSPAWQPAPWTPAKNELLPPRFFDVLALKILVSQPAYCFASEVQSEARQAECQQQLRKLFELIKAHDRKHGSLPKAAFYPVNPTRDTDSLLVILGEKAGRLSTCPTCSPELKGMGLNYVWNTKLSGKPLDTIQRPGETWLLMDFVGTHDWMTANSFCGHRKGVNILYADGTVRWSPPYSTEAWGGKDAIRWVDWAAE